MPLAIDLSRLAPPAAIELLSDQQLFDAFLSRFATFWAQERERDPQLPVFEIGQVQHEPVVIVGWAFAYLRLLDRQRVNDAIKAVLAPLATGTDLDNVVARQGIQRLVVIPAANGSPAVMETDIALLRRYLLSFDRPSAGSRDRYLYEAWTALPTLLDARVNGFDVHGRRGDTDVVIIGQDGEPVSAEERDLVSAAVRAPHVKPEAVSVAVLHASRAEYEASFVIEIPTGPDAEIVRLEAVKRIELAAASRMLIGGEIPAGFLKGAAYGESVIKVRDLAPVVIEPDPYTVPVMTGLDVAVEVRS